jgi:hypothetical protein
MNEQWATKTRKGFKKDICLLWGGSEGKEEVFVLLDFSVQLQVTFRDMCIPAVLLNNGDDPDDLPAVQEDVLPP